MRLEGRVWKDGKFWLSEIPGIDLMTQGHSRANAVAMMAEAIDLLIDKKDFAFDLLPGKGDIFSIQVPKPGPLLALMLKRQRVKNNLSIRQVVERMKGKSKNEYAQYEQGKSEPSLSKLQQFLKAFNTQSDLVLKVV